MANRSKIKLEIRVRNNDGKYIFCAPVFAANGRLRPLWASLSGNHETHPEGTYYLRYTDDSGKRVYEPVGKNANAAVKIMRSRQLARAGAKVDLQVVDPGSVHMHIDDAVAVYLAWVAISRSQRTQNEFNLLLPSSGRFAARFIWIRFQRKTYCSMLHGCGNRTLLPEPWQTG